MNTQMSDYIYKAVGNGEKGFSQRGILKAKDMADAVAVAHEDARLWAEDRNIPEGQYEVVSIRKGLQTTETQ